MKEKNRDSRETGTVPQTRVATSFFDDLALRSDEAAAATCATSTSVCEGYTLAGAYISQTFCTTPVQKQQKFGNEPMASVQYTYIHEWVSSPQMLLLAVPQLMVDIFSLL